MIFAIDFDKTFTTDETFWAEFVLLAQDRGHLVYCVTSRRASDDAMAAIAERFDVYRMVIPIIFCEMKSKQNTLQNMGIDVDVWIDDSPYGIIHDYERASDDKGD